MALDNRQIIPVDKNPVKSIHPEFIDMLRRAESDNLYAVSNCGDIYKEVICDESDYLRRMGDTSQHVARSNKPVFCRKRHECYRCARLENIRLRDVSRQKFAEVARCAGSQVEFGWMTYTMGHSVWKHITEDNIGEYVHLAIEVTKELFGEDLVIGGVASPHY